MLRSPRKHLLIKAKAVSLAPSSPAALHNEDTIPMSLALLNSHTWGSLDFGVCLPIHFLCRAGAVHGLTSEVLERSL